MALLEALESGQIGGCALDVHWDEPFELHRSEPLGTRGAKLVESGKLICTPHNAWYSVESRLEMRLLEDEAVVAALLAASDGALELIDTRDLLPGLKRATGYTSWTVMDDKLISHSSIKKARVAAAYPANVLARATM